MLSMSQTIMRILAGIPLQGTKPPMLLVRACLGSGFLASLFHFLQEDAVQQMQYYNTLVQIHREPDFLFILLPE